MKPAHHLAMIVGCASVVAVGAAWILGAAGACAPAAATVTAAVDDPRVSADARALDRCRVEGSLAQADAGSDASQPAQRAAFAVYCACTVDAGLRATCVGVGP